MERCERRDVRVLTSHFMSLLIVCRDVGAEEKVTPHAEQEAWEQHQIGEQCSAPWQWGWQPVARQ